MNDELSESLLKDLIDEIRRENKQSEEKLFILLFSEMKSYAANCEKRYRDLGLDSGDFIYEFYEATKRVIATYENDKGDFLFYWRRTLKIEAMRLVNSVLRKSRMTGEHNQVRYDTLEPWKQDIVFNSFREESPDYSRADSSGRILAFLRKHYSPVDFRMLLGWLGSRSFKELGQESGLTARQASSRVYNMLATVRRNFVRKKDKD